MKDYLLSENISVKIKKHRASRNLKISISQDGKVRLTIPYYFPYYLGEKYLKEKKTWIIETLSKVTENNQEKVIINEQQEKTLRIKARADILKLVNHYCLIYNLTYHKIFIKGQRSLWGSCSQKKNLNFNWRLMLAPERILHYVVVHEVCHLREMNHSKNFWQLVALTIPEYQECRRWLLKNGHSLY